MSKPVSSTEANRDFSKLLRRVTRGEEVQITSRGRPVATMAPVHERSVEREQARSQLLKRLKASPISGRRDWTREELHD